MPHPAPDFRQQPRHRWLRDYAEIVHDSADGLRCLGCNRPLRVVKSSSTTGPGDSFAGELVIQCDFCQVAAYVLDAAQRERVLQHDRRTNSAS